MPSQTAVIKPKMNIKLAIGRRNGFWNLFTFSINGIVIRPAGTAAIANTPNNLFGNTRNKLILTFYQKPNETALSIGKHAPIPNQTAKINPIMNVKLTNGRRNGF